MKDKITERLGLISAILTTFAFVPGVIEVWRMKPAPAVAISTPMYLMFFVGVIGWLVYGLRIKSKPVILSNATTILLSLSILIYKFIYG